MKCIRLDRLRESLHTQGRLPRGFAQSKRGLDAGNLAREKCSRDLRERLRACGSEAKSSIRRN